MLDNLSTTTPDSDQIDDDVLRPEEAAALEELNKDIARLDGIFQFEKTLQAALRSGDNAAIDRAVEDMNKLFRKHPPLSQPGVSPK